MRIIAAKAHTVRLGAAARSSSISFEDMTATALAIHTGARRDGKALVGLAFNSIGRYDHSGLLNDRFIPRLLAAERRPARLRRRGWRHRIVPGLGYRDEERKTGRPRRAVWSGRAYRCGDMGSRSQAVELPLWRHLSKVEPVKGNGSDVADVYVSGGHYRPHNDVESLCDDVRRAMGDGHRGWNSRSAALHSVLTSNASRQC